MLYWSLITQYTQDNLTQVHAVHSMYTRNDEILSRTGTSAIFNTSQTIASCIHLLFTYLFGIHDFLDFSYEDNLIPHAMAYLVLLLSQPFIRLHACTFFPRNASWRVTLLPRISLVICFMVLSLPVFSKHWNTLHYSSACPSLIRILSVKRATRTNTLHYSSVCPSLIRIYYPLHAQRGAHNTLYNGFPIHPHFNYPWLHALTSL